jgi:hypothetical protein
MRYVLFVLAYSAAIALGANPATDQLPRDIKSEILSYIVSGHEKHGHTERIFIAIMRDYLMQPKPW